MAVQAKTRKSTAEVTPSESKINENIVESITEKVASVKNQIAGVYGDEESLLMKMLKETENLTRSTINIELEIKRQNELGKDLADTNKALAKELESLDSKNTTLLNNQKEIERGIKK